MSETVDVNLTSRKPLDTLVPLLSLGCLGAMGFRMYQLEVRVGELEKESDNHDKMTFTPIQRPKPKHDRPPPPPPPPPPPAYRDDRRRREVYHEAEEDLHDIDDEEDDEEEEGLPPTDPTIESDSKAKSDPDGKHE